MATLGDEPIAGAMLLVGAVGVAHVGIEEVDKFAVVSSKGDEGVIFEGKAECAATFVTENIIKKYWMVTVSALENPHIQIIRPQQVAKATLLHLHLAFGVQFKVRGKKNKFTDLGASVSVPALVLEARLIIDADTEVCAPVSIVTPFLKLHSIYTSCY